MDNKPAEWKIQQQPFFSLDEGLESTLADISEGITNITDVLTDVREILTEISGLFDKPGESIGKKIKEFSDPLIQQLTGYLSMGAGAIVIHPFNVTNGGRKNWKYPIDLMKPVNTAVQSVAASLIAGELKFKVFTEEAIPKINSSWGDLVDISERRVSSGRTTLASTSTPVTSTAVPVKMPKTSPYPIPSLTPRDAFNEFYASFTNKNDPLRPKWSDITEVTGVGFVMTTGNIVAFLNFATNIAQLFNLSDIIKSMKHATSDITNLIAKGKNNAMNSEVADTLKEEWKKFAEGYASYENNKNGEQQKTVKAFGDLLMNQLSGQYRWIGLNVYNLPILDAVFSKITTLINKIALSIIGKENPIAEIIKTILKKLDAIMDVLNTINSVYTTLVTTFKYAGFYTFSIPKGFGGVDYIKNSLESSLSTSPIAPVMDSSQFTILVFAGASSGKMNLDVFKSLIDSSMTIPTDKVKSLVDYASFSYSVVPKFDKTTFDFGQKVKISINSFEATDDAPLYFTYTLSEENKIISSQLQTDVSALDVAKVNKSHYDVTLGTAGKTGIEKFSFSFKIFGYRAKEGQPGLVYTKFVDKTITFVINSEIPAGLDPRIKDGEDASQPDAEGDTTIIVRGGGGEEGTSARWNTGENGPRGRELSKTLISDGNPLLIPDTSIGKEGDLSLEIRDSQGNSIILPLENFKGYDTYDYDSLEAFILNRVLVVEDVPLMLCLNFEGEVKYRLAGSTEYTIVSLPSCIKITEAGVYEFWFLIDGIMSGPYYFNIKLQDVTALPGACN